MIKWQIVYSKTCLKRPCKYRQNKDPDDKINGCLMKVKSLQNAPLGALCNTFDNWA